MAFMGAEIIRVVTRRARATMGKGIMGRVWGGLALILLTLATFRSFIPVLNFVREELVPHVRDSTLTVFNTQPLLFLLLNSMIFAVLAPSGLFNDTSSASASQLSDESSSSAGGDSDERPAGDPDPPPVVVKPEEEPPVPPVSPPVSSKRERRVRSTDGSSPPKARVKRKRSTAQKCQSLKHQITLGFVENGELGEECGGLNSLKDEDFNHFIDSFHHDLLRQEREYAMSSRTI